MFEQECEDETIKPILLRCLKIYLRISFKVIGNIKAYLRKPVILLKADKMMFRLLVSLMREKPCCVVGGESVCGKSTLA